LFVKTDDEGRPGEAAATLIEALRRMGEGAGTQKSAASLFEQLAKGGERTAGLESQFYDALREGLANWEREARRHAEFVDKLLTPKAAEKPAPASPYQETLYLQGAAGGRTAGKFRALNRRDKRVSVATLTRPFTLAGQPALAAPSLTLRPGAFYLEPGEARVVSVEAELPGPGRYESAVDLTMDEAVALKLWIEIDVYS
jgi:Asp-tRNA(Asn)/Glu-tRNA(Gln) amidotransferase A subunit family amidase